MALRLEYRGNEADAEQLLLPNKNVIRLTIYAIRKTAQWAFMRKRLGKQKSNFAASEFEWNL